MSKAILKCTGKFAIAVSIAVEVLRLWQNIVEERAHRSKGGHRLPDFNKECGYFRDQVNDGCAFGSLSGKIDFALFLLSLYLLAISKKYQSHPQTPSF
jgi:hypothetical protein